MAERGAPASNPAANERPRGVLPSLQRALLVTLLLAGLRAAFVLLRDDYLAGGLWGHALRSFSRHLLLGGIMGFAPLLVLLFLGTTARARVGRWAGWLVVVPGAVGLYLFASLRWPSYPHYAPGWESLPGWVANGIAASVALVGAALLIWDARLPLRRSLVGAACAAFASAAGVYLLAPTTNRTGKPNLILISLDTLRRDHLGCYGYERPTSPELDAFAARSLRFTESFAPQPWTLTSHMSMLTGLYPSAHDLEEDRALPFGVRTLAELLGVQGYDTLAVVDHLVLLAPRYGFDRGFDSYNRVRDVAALKRRRIDQLLDDTGGSPFFMFMHFYDAHSDWRYSPYEASEEDVQAFAGGFDPDHRWQDEAGRTASSYLLAMIPRKEVLAGEALEHLESLYDAGVRTLDRELGQLFASLERRGLLENSVILITADHGEEFFDHGRALHSQCYDECLRVPFLLYTPWGTPGTTDALTSHVDILPTFLELAGAPRALSQGISLAPLTRGEPLQVEREAVVIERRGGHIGLRSRGWSLVPGFDGLQLFDVGADPQQEVNLLEQPTQAPQTPGILALLERETNNIKVVREAMGQRGEGVEMSAADLDQLRALGYVGDE